MNKIGNFARWVFSEARTVLDWAISNWAITAIVLIMLIFWTSRQRRLSRNYL
jgi:hypothetical protein